MESSQAVVGFSQSEKVKAGLIWMSHTLQILESMDGPERKGAERLIASLLHMIAHEVRISVNVAGMGDWDEIDACINRALSMVESGVGHEAVVHLSKALSKTTSIGQKTMSRLKSEGIL